MILRGIWLLARGQAEGIEEFGNSRDALTASLAPLVAFPLVGAAITAINGEPKQAVLAFLARLCAVLVVPAITYEFARFTKRDTLWLRTAAALNWLFWMILPLLLVAGFIGVGLVLAGVPQTDAEHAALGLICAYLLWLQWFAVRSGLKLRILPAALLVALNGLAVGLFTWPELLIRMGVL